MALCIKPSDLPELFRETRAASMLFGLAQVKNGLFNIASSAFRIPVTAVAAGLEQTAGRAAAAVTGQPFQQTQYMSEAVAHLYGFFHALPLTLKTYGRQVKITRDAAIKGAFEKVAERGGTGASIMSAAGKAISPPFEGLRWMDDFSFNFNYAAQMYRYAFRRAKQEGYRGWGAAIARTEQIINEQAQKVGALSSRVAAEVTAKQAKIGVTDPTILRELISKELRRAGPSEFGPEFLDPLVLAERTIFVNREGRGLDRLLDTLEKIDESTFRAVSLLAPFRRTPANEAREFLRGTPIGLGTAAMKYAQAIAQGLDPKIALTRAYEDAAQATVGTMALGSIWYALQGGMIKVTPFYSGKSKALRTTEAAAGESQDSVTIGDHNIPVRNLGSLGQAILTTAQAKRELDALRETRPEGIATSEKLAFLARQATFGTFMGVADQQFLQNLIEMHEAWKNPETSLPQFAQRFGASFVPSIVRAVARAGQPVVPVPEEEAKQGLVRNILAGARQAVAPEGVAKLGLFGEPVIKPPGIPGVIGGIQQETQDPLLRKMLEVGAVHLAPNTNIELKIKGKKVKFVDVYSPDDQVMFGQAKGALQRAYMQAQLTAPGFARLVPEQQKMLLDAAFLRAGRAVDGRMRSFAKFGKRPNYRDLLRGLLPSVR